MTYELYAIGSDGKFFKHSLPKHAHENQEPMNATQIGSDGWADFKFVFLDPHIHANGDLYVVKMDGTFLKGSPPTNLETRAEDWCTHARTIGKGEWADFEFLFFDYGGILHAVRKNGSFCKGSPPKDENDNWSARAEPIGTNGWNDFKFLFFGSDGHLYAVKERDNFWHFWKHGPFWKDTPPKYERDNWIARATKIGTNDWNNFEHLFFGPNGHLYAVNYKKNGTFHWAPAPTRGNDNWIARADKFGAGQWKDYKFLLWNSTSHQ